MKLITAGAVAIALTAAATQVHAQEVSEEGATVMRFLGFSCDDFSYEEDCLAQISTSIENAAELSETDQQALHAKIRAYKEKYGFLSEKIDAILVEYEIPVTDPA